MAFNFNNLTERNVIDDLVSRSGFVVVNCRRTEPCNIANKRCNGCTNRCVDYDSFENKYLWIGKFREGQNKICYGDIGCRNCHFEIGRYNRNYYVDLHFESQESYPIFKRRIIDRLYPSGNAPDHLTDGFFESNPNRTRLKVVRFASKGKIDSILPEKFDSVSVDFDNFSGIDDLFEQIRDYGRGMFDNGRSLIEELEDILTSISNNYVIRGGYKCLKKV